MTKINSTKIIVIIGPTASGKSSLGIFLARKLRGEIISADSRQVYHGMDIGTGKVTKKEQRIARHHLLDVANPKKIFTVSDFKKLGQKAIINIVGRKKLPFVVGGTGFYIDALVYNLNFPQVPPNKPLRLNLNKLTSEKLFYKLKKLDPQRAKIIDRHNKRRLIRALEIIDSIGKVPDLNTKYEIHNTKYDVLWLGLNPNKEKLIKKIKKRLDERLKQGMVKEVKNLHKQGVSWKRLDDFGLEYRQISRWLKSSKLKQKQSFSNSQEYENLLRDIIKYSKRQMTWFKRNKDIHWVKSEREAEKITKKFIFPLP